MPLKCPFFKDLCYEENCMFWESEKRSCIIVEYLRSAKPKKQRRSSLREYPISETSLEITRGELSNILKKKLLTEKDLKNISEDFGLSALDFNSSRDYVINSIVTMVLNKGEAKRLKEYLKKFQDAESGRRGIDYKKLEKQIDLTGKGS